MVDKLMYIPVNDTQNYPLFRLKFVVETFELKNSVLIFGTSIINRPLAPLSYLLEKNQYCLTLFLTYKIIKVFLLTFKP